MSLIDIIIPTFNSPEYAVPCVNSILRNYDGTDLFRIFVVNNGSADHAVHFPAHPAVTFLQQPKNLGWEGGLKAGLHFSKAPYVLFMNDDTLVPQSDSNWLRTMVNHFVNPRVAGVGPSSNFVMGIQQIFADAAPVVATHFIIGLCFMVRRSDLDEVGGVDDQLPGGDDLDLSLRLREKGKILVADRTVFIYHHGQKTGRKVHGTDWDSIDHQERVKFALIGKHGLKKYLSLFTGPAYEEEKETVLA